MSVRISKDGSFRVGTRRFYYARRSPDGRFVTGVLPASSRNGRRIAGLCVLVQRLTGEVLFCNDIGSSVLVAVTDSGVVVCVDEGIAPGLDSHVVRGFSVDGTQIWKIGDLGELDDIDNLADGESVAISTVGTRSVLVDARTGGIIDPATALHLPLKYRTKGVPKS